MKKLRKLSINIDKIIKNDELVNLRGGDYYGPPGGGTWDRYCWDYFGLEAFQCKCEYPAVGLWRGCYTDQVAADATIADNCSNGLGSCDELFNV